MVLRIKPRVLLSAVVWSTLVFSCGCGYRYYAPPPAVPDDRRDVPEIPKEREYNITADLFDQQVTLQIEQALDLSRQCRNLLGIRKQSYNVDAFDEVCNSSWFTNRNAKQKLTLEEISRGPDRGFGPDTTGPWLVTRAKVVGVTPGFSIKDIKGDVYVIKFDPLGYPELVTGAEVVSTKLIHAAGYNVPENYITYFRPEVLHLAENVKFTDQNGEKRRMTPADLDDLLAGIQTLPDGRIRALASKYIPGRPIGPFSYRNTRKDDPNDIIPHQHRRELRGLKVVAAWLNHIDTKSGNSLDTYINEDGTDYVKHYLIDFGTTLGSAAHGPMTPETGHENQIDPNEIFLNIATLGIYVRPYEELKPHKHPSVGLYESDLFNPGGFKFSVPNPAFDNCTGRDGYWGAKLVMSFTDDQLRAAVKQGQYSDDDAVAYLVRVLKERRDKTGRYWFNRVNPLDDFRIERGDNGEYQLRFTDLAVEYGLESADATSYLYDLKCDGKTIRTGADTGKKTCIGLFLGPSERLSFNAAPAHQWEIVLRTVRESKSRVSKWIRVYVDFDEENEEPKLAGLRRQD